MRCRLHIIVTILLSALGTIAVAQSQERSFDPEKVQAAREDDDFQYNEDAGGEVEAKADRRKIWVNRRQSAQDNYASDETLNGSSGYRSYSGDGGNGYGSNDPNKGGGNNYSSDPNGTGGSGSREGSSGGDISQDPNSPYNNDQGQSREGREMSGDRNGGGEGDHNSEREPTRESPTTSSPPKLPDKTTADGVSGILMVIGILIIVAVVAVVIYMVSKNAGKSKKGDRKTKPASNEEEVTEENLMQVNVIDHIEEAIRLGQYRKATRLLYLNVLKAMAEKRLITWAIDKTNRDYSSELKPGDLKHEFAQVSFMYEYIWYGEIPLDKERFDSVHQAFKNIQKRIQQS